MALRTHMSQVRCVSAVPPTTAVNRVHDQIKAKLHPVARALPGSPWHCRLPAIRCCHHTGQTHSVANRQEHHRNSNIGKKCPCVCSLPEAKTLVVSSSTLLPFQPGLPSFWKSQQSLSYSKNSLWVRKQRWSNIFSFSWWRRADTFKQLSQWCTIWIMLSEFVPQIRRDGKPRLCSALVFLTHSFAGMKVVTQKLPPFALKPSLMPHNNYLLFLPLRLSVIKMTNVIKGSELKTILGGIVARGQKGWVEQQLPLAKLQHQAISSHCECQQTLKWS